MSGKTEFIAVAYDDLAKTDEQLALTRTGEELEKIKTQIDQALFATFESRSAQVYSFIKEYESKTYKPGDWKEWNRAFLRALAIPAGSDELILGTVRRFEEYLSGQTEIPAPIDGKIGPIVLQRLKAFMIQAFPEGNQPEARKQQPSAAPPAPKREVIRLSPTLVAREKSVGWVEGVTKNYFFLRDKDTKVTGPNAELQGEVFYVLNNGQWVDYDHDPIDLKEILPKLATGNEVNGYYRVTDGSGVLRYVDRQGKMYAGMPIPRGTEQWAKAEQPEQPNERA